MYAHTGIDAAAHEAAAAAEPRIRADRARYAPLQHAVAAYAAKVGSVGSVGSVGAAGAADAADAAPLYLSGGRGILALFGTLAPDARAACAANLETPFQYDFYTTDAPRHAAGLARAVNAAARADAATRDFITAATYDAKQGAYSVEVDSRQLAVLWILPRPPRGVSRAVLAPVYADVDGLNVPCVPPEVQLYDVYRALGDPARAAEWPVLLQQEHCLFALTSRDIRERIARATAADAAGGAADHERLVGVLQRFVAGSGRAVIGRRDVLQAVTARALADEARAIIAAAAKIGVPVDVRVVDVGLPVDPELRRLKVYRLRKGARSNNVLDVFNAAEYSLVPLAGDYSADSAVSGGYGADSEVTGEYGADSAVTGEYGADSAVTGGRRSKRRLKNKHPVATNKNDKNGRVVSAFGQLRFAAADLWTAMVLHQRGVVDGARARTLVYRVFDAMVDMRERAIAAGRNDIERILPTKAAHYFGTYVTPAILGRRRLRSRKGPHPVRGFPIVLQAYIEDTAIDATEPAHLAEDSEAEDSEAEDSDTEEYGAKDSDTEEYGAKDSSGDASD